jgi:hypothetical protein
MNIDPKPLVICHVIVSIRVINNTNIEFTRAYELRAIQYSPNVSCKVNI